VFAPVFYIRICFTYLAKKALNLEDTNCFFKCLICCSQCGLNFLELVSDYVQISNLPYIAITGDPFCKGVWGGLLMEIHHLLEFSTAMSIALLTIWLTKLMLVALSMVTCTFVVREVFEQAYYLNNYAWVVVIIGALTYLFANLCLGMFQTVIYQENIIFK
jgi:hypothetical protein